MIKTCSFILLFLNSFIGLGQLVLLHSDYKQSSNLFSANYPMSTFMYNGSIYSLGVNHDRINHNDTDKYNVSIRLYRLSGHNDTISSAEIYSKANSLNGFAFFKTIIVNHEVWFFYSTPGIRASYPHYYDSVGCLKYNFLSGKARISTFLLDTAIFFFPNTDVIKVKDKIIFALASKRPNFYYYNYYKMYDTSFNFIKEQYINTKHYYYIHKLLNGKDNSIYHYFSGDVECGTPNFAPFFTLRKIDTSLSLISEMEFNDTTKIGAGTYTDVSFEHNYDTTELNITRLVNNSAVTPGVNRNHAYFWDYDDSLRLKRQVLTFIPPESYCSNNCNIFRAVRYYNKRYILALTFDNICDNYLFAFNKDLNFVKKYNFQISDPRITNIDYTYRSFFFHNGSSLFQVPLENIDGILNRENENALSFYPNPATNEINLCLPSKNENYTVKVFSTTGLLVKKLTLENGIRFNVSDLNSGMYYFEVSIEGTPILTRKFVKI